MMKSSSVNILPQPFAWIPIPEGDVILIHDEEIHPDNYLETDTNFHVSRFEISKYPITNAQFRIFIEAGGYSNDRWWTVTGKQERDKYQWIQPLYWHDTQWNSDDFPVVGISWYEAIAFCMWLSDLTGENIALPTEQQWQRAAQGDDGREYPWGKEFDFLRCNNSYQQNSNHTTPVYQYESIGASPYGVVDMVGNIWEWCLTDYYVGGANIEGANLRLIRGGSWYTSGTFFFTTYHRNGASPDARDDISGFRIARI
ncbi:MAG: formylglycine-generating enzyme family protein [Anaerolineae bacterium]|nr:formylglycine-generating enzyme family protein [Anaerolineae bacterium]